MGISRFVLSGWLLAAAAAHAQSVGVTSGATEVDLLRGRVTAFPVPAGRAIADVRVELKQSRLEVQPLLMPAAGEAAGARSFAFEIGRLPAGSYSVELVDAAGTLLASAALLVRAHADPLRANLSGHYWNPDEPGWGLMLWHRPADDAAYGVWFTYRDFQPFWLALQQEAPPLRFMGELERIPLAPVETWGPPIATTFEASQVRLAARHALPGTVHGITAADRRSVTFAGSAAFAPPRPRVHGPASLEAYISDVARQSLPLVPFRSTPPPATPATVASAPGDPPRITVPAGVIAGHAAELLVEQDTPVGAEGGYFTLDARTAQGALELRGRMGVRAGDLPVAGSALRSVARVQVGPFPQGRYPIRAYAGPAAIDPAASATLVVSAPPSRQGGPWLSFSDQWWNPDEPGWGMMVWHDPDEKGFMAAWFGYGSDGTATWFTVQDGSFSTFTRDGAIGWRYTGSVYTTLGTDFRAPGFILGRVTRAGSAIIEFTDADAGTLNFTLASGAWRSTRIARFK